MSTDPLFSLLSWNSFKKNVCDGFYHLQQKGEFVDMTLAADGHLVKVHQNLIALASPYLKGILQSIQCQHPVIFLNDVSHEVLCYLLQYIYTGEVPLPNEKLESFLKAAKNLKITGIENLILPHHAKNLSKIKKSAPTSSLNSVVGGCTATMTNIDLVTNNKNETLAVHQFSNDETIDVELIQDTGNNAVKSTEFQNADIQEKSRNADIPEKGNVHSKLKSTQLQNTELQEKRNNNNHAGLKSTQLQSTVIHEKRNNHAALRAIQIQNAGVQEEIDNATFKSTQLQNKSRTQPIEIDISLPVISETYSLMNETADTFGYNMSSSSTQITNTNKDIVKDVNSIEPVHSEGDSFIEPATDISNMQLQYSISNKGRPQVILNRFIYYLHHQSKNAQKKRWRCIDYRRLHCPAYLDTNNYVISERKYMHSHSFHDKKIVQKINAKRVLTSLVNARESDESGGSNEVLMETT